MMLPNLLIIATYDVSTAEEGTKQKAATIQHGERTNEVLLLLLGTRRRPRQSLLRVVVGMVIFFVGDLFLYFILFIYFLMAFCTLSAHDDASSSACHLYYRKLRRSYR